MSTASDRRLSAPSSFVVRFIETYRDHVGPGIDAKCRFEPSCSQYGLEAYRMYGFIKATLKIMGRLRRCRRGYEGPFIDPP